MLVSQLFLARIISFLYKKIWHLPCRGHFNQLQSKYCTAKYQQWQRWLAHSYPLWLTEVSEISLKWNLHRKMHFCWTYQRKKFKQIYIWNSSSFKKKAYLKGMQVFSSEWVVLLRPPFYSSKCPHFWKQRKVNVNYKKVTILWNTYLWWLIPGSLNFSITNILSQIFFL